MGWHLGYHNVVLSSAGLRFPCEWRMVRPQPEVRGDMSVPLESAHIVGALRERGGERGIAAAMTIRAHDRWRFLHLSEEASATFPPLR